MASGDFEPRFALKHMFKDVQLALAAGHDAGIDLPATAASAVRSWPASSMAGATSISPPLRSTTPSPARSARGRNAGRSKRAAAAQKPKRFSFFGARGKLRVSERIEHLRAHGGAFAVAMCAFRRHRCGSSPLPQRPGLERSPQARARPRHAACVLSAKASSTPSYGYGTSPSVSSWNATPPLAEPLAMRLERNIVADDVTVEPLPPTLTFHVFGSAAEGLEVRKFPVSARSVSMFPRRPRTCSRRRPTKSSACASSSACRGGCRTRARHAARRGRPRRDRRRFSQRLLHRAVKSYRASAASATRTALCVCSTSSPASRLRPARNFSRTRIPPARPRRSRPFTLHCRPPIGLCYIRRGTAEGAVLEAPAGASRIQLRPCVTPS